MLETSTTGTRAGTDAGFTEHLRSFAATGFDYLSARFQLAGIESKEASVHYLKILGFVAVAVAALLFGYVFLCVGLVFVIAYLTQAQWMWVMLAFAALHLIAAAICLAVAKKRIASPMFTETLNEFKKDRQWLNRKSF
jgi:uncharacterized membrane protein YqjE